MAKSNLKIYNTLSQKKEAFKPQKQNKVNIFVCGITVNNYSHLGHARNYIVFDSFVKYLREKKYKVFYLQNITDIDDKIIASAREKKVAPKDLAKAFSKEAMKSMKLVGINSVTKYAKATHYIKEIISQVKRLQDKGYAYKINGDGIYYDIAKFKNYGSLAGRTALQAEDSISRIDYSKNKKNRGDFCLWKFKQEEFEPSWPSPFGEGRPGWHIEDTAITEKFFGPQYDIHGAGRDLIFPHHEAEISQMEAISNKKPMAKYWMHVGFLTVNGQKMSKSLGNFITIDDFLKRYSAEHLRFLILKNLWSSPIDYSDSAMIEIRSILDKMEEFLGKLHVISKKFQTSEKIQISKIMAKAEKDFFEQLDDNFNTPKAFAALFEFMKEINKIIDNSQLARNEARKILNFFEKINKIFGIINFKNVKNRNTIPAKIKSLARDRERYRKSQEWQKADEARAEIEKQGFIIEDTKNGPVVKKIYSDI